jgi:dTDP-4-amino-4,6-dideoxygalactose transaminase
LDDKVHFPPDYADLMLGVEAMVGMEQLKKYHQIIAQRRENADWYHNNLPRQEGWIFPPLVEGATYSHYVIRVPDRHKEIVAFAKAGVHLGELIQYSVPELGSYHQSTEREYKHSALASHTTINVPIHAGITKIDRQKNKRCHTNVGLKMLLRS